MGDSAHTTRHTNPGKNPHTPFFLEEENIFKNRPPWYKFYSDSPLYHGGRFSKNVAIFEEKAGSSSAGSMLVLGLYTGKAMNFTIIDIEF